MKTRLNQVAPLFQKYDSPISVAVRMAQFALESQAGQSDLFKKSNNGFGIKASAPYTGDKVLHNSMEVGGAQDSYFRKYPSLEASVKDHASFFTSTPFRQSDAAYGLAIKADNYRDEAKYLGPKFPGDKSSYAGDPKYAEKLIAIIERYDLTQYDIKRSGKMAYIGIDIGHGSNTWSSGGGKGVVVNGKTYEEHNFNSIVAKKLKALLEQSGHKVTFGVQQPNSPDTSLRSRTNRFNAEGVDFMISIHANWIGSFGNATNGIGLFYASYSNGLRRTESLKASKLIMNEFINQGQTIYNGGLGDGRGSIPSTYNSWTNFHMTREVGMPAILAELGFMSGNRDFDKIFGSQQAKYTTEMAEGIAKGLNKYFGVEDNIKTTYNPQDLETQKAPEYTAPEQPFKKIEVGQTVTIDDDFRWYDLGNQELMLSKRHDEIKNTQDVIKEVKVLDDPRSNSKVVYLLEKYNSWILEEELLEAREDWKEAEDIEPIEDGFPILKDNQFYYRGKIYQYEEVGE